MTSDEINPSRQRGISVDVLAERISNLGDTNRSEFSALHHHFASLEVKVDNYVEKVASIETALHEHVTQQHHVGTRDRLLELQQQHLDFERKFGEIDRKQAEHERINTTKFADIEKARLIEKAATEARTQQRTMGFTALEKAWLWTIMAVPVVILLIDRFS